jgi:uncharacterized protein (DUF1778 family)
MSAAANSSVLSVRVSRDERALLEAAAEQSRTSLSDFVRRKAIEAAEAEILERSTVVIPAADWEAFEAWARRPAKASPVLRELLDLTPTWER